MSNLGKRPLPTSGSKGKANKNIVKKTFDSFHCDGMMEIEYTNLQGEHKKHKVHTYYLTLSSNPGVRVNDTAYISAVPGSNSLYQQRTFAPLIAVQSILDELKNKQSGRKATKVAVKAYQNNEYPLPILDITGDPDPSGLLLFNSVFSSKPVNDGKVKNSKKRGQPGSAGKAFELTSDDAEAVEHQKYFQFWINYVLKAKHLTGYRYDVFSRFFDKSFNIPVRFILAIPREYASSICKNSGYRIQSRNEVDYATKILEENIGEMTKKLRFQPSVEIRFEGLMPSSRLILISSHPGQLFMLWADKDSYELWKKQKTTESWPIQSDRRTPDEDEAREANEELGCRGIKEDYNIPNRSDVTIGSLKNGAETIRKPSQKAVMNNVSPNDLVRKWWDLGPIDQEAEWLHRCAHSFGGLYEGDDKVVDANNAQTPRNLVIGTKDCNTNMIRAEAYVKRLVQNMVGGKVRVETLIRYDSPRYSKPYMKTERYIWLAPRLSYNIKPINKSKNQMLRGALMSFYPFRRQLVTRFEVELDIIMEKLVLNWNVVTTLD